MIGLVVTLVIGVFLSGLLLWSSAFWGVQWRWFPMDGENNYIKIEYKYYMIGAGWHYFNGDVEELDKALNEKGIWLQENPDSEWVWKRPVPYGKPCLYVQWGDKRSPSRIVRQTWRILQNFMEAEW
jgi:hypothetical protein